MCYVTAIAKKKSSLFKIWHKDLCIMQNQLHMFRRTLLNQCVNTDTKIISQCITAYGGKCASLCVYDAIAAAKIIGFVRISAQMFMCYAKLVV